VSESKAARPRTALIATTRSETERCLESPTRSGFEVTLQTRIERDALEAIGTSCRGVRLVAGPLSYPVSMAFTFRLEVAMDEVERAFLWM
jgi:hypothetical protein